MSDKYPRTFHLPWSPGLSKDDRKILSLDSLLGTEIVITEKLDGSNSCLTKDGVYARSHSKLASHPSFNLLKSQWHNIKDKIKANQMIFGENCFAVHTIEYEELPSYFFAFNIKEDLTWLSYDDLLKISKDLGLMTAPLLFRGIAKNEKDLKSITLDLMKKPSLYGGEKEGLVARVASSFKDSDFSLSVAKYVRKDHVQTDDHWMFQSIRKQKISK